MSRGWAWSLAVALIAMAFGYDQWVGPGLASLRRGAIRRSEPVAVSAGWGGYAGGVAGWSSVTARRAGTPACRERIDAAWSDVDAAGEEYLHPALQQLHGLVRMTGTAYPVLAECTLADLSRLMTFNLEREALPLQREFTRDGSHIALTVTEPAEPWAIARGYLYKGYVSVDTRPQIVLYWSGVGEATRGFLIQAPVDARGGAPSRGAAYVLWERTGSPQRVKLWVAEVGEGGLDRALYSELSFERAVSRIDLKAISMEPPRGQATLDRLGCFRVAATGRLDDKLRIGRTIATLGEKGHDTESMFVDGSELEWIETPDARSAGENGETLVGGRDVRFTKSCRDLGDAVLPGAPFGIPDDVVDFFAGPQDVFGE